MSEKAKASADLYQSEYAILANAEAFTKSKKLTKESLVESHREITRQYKTLLRQVSKITALGDGVQSKLRRTQEELRDTLTELEKAQALMRAEMSLARQIQRQLLPIVPPQVSGLEIHSEYIALEEVGGDFIDYTVGDDGTVGILIGDATGHGVPAALLAAMAKMAMDNLRHLVLRPRELLLRLNTALVGKTSNHFVTVCYGVFQPGSRTLKLGIAGHPPPILLRKGKPPTIVAGRGQMLGFFADVKIGEAEVSLEPGDRVLFLTDGVLECIGQDSVTEIDESVILSMLSEVAHFPAEQMLRSFTEGLRSYVGKRGFNDDLTLVLMSPT